MEINLKSYPNWIKVSGHCGGSLKERIVCSAISTLVQSLYVGLTQVLKLEICGIIKRGKFKILLPEVGEEKRNEVKFALTVFSLSVKKIARQYKCVKFVEVRG